MKNILLQILFGTTIFLSAKAQVIFHDVNPDVELNQVIPGQVSFIVDMTNDGDTDFQIINSYFTVGDSTYSEATVLADSGNAVAVDNQNYPLALEADTMVDGSLDFQSQNFGPLRKITSAFGVPSSFSGNWNNANDRFLGVRFKDNDTTKYGWIEMSMSTNIVTVVTIILDYAYENSGSGILTQDSLAIIGIQNVEETNRISIHSLNNIVIVNYNGHLSSPMRIKVIDICGREIKDFITRNQEVHIDLSTVREEVYVITAQEGKEMIRKKIMVM